MGLSDAGFDVLPRVLDEATVEALVAVLEGARELARIRTRGGLTYGSRNVLDVPAVRALVQSPAFAALVTPVLGPGALAVRGLLFDKQARANWRVPWHQDLVVAVRARCDVKGFANWSTKAGVLHVQPPVAVLERMLAVRLQLDDGGPESGPLRVLPGSHAHGRLAPDEVSAWAARVEPRDCLAPRGAVVRMRPLLLHASGLATRPGRRRVLHVECAAAGALPAPLEWASAVTVRGVERPAPGSGMSRLAREDTGSGGGPLLAPPGGRRKS